MQLGMQEKRKSVTLKNWQRRHIGKESVRSILSSPALLLIGHVER